MKTSLSVNIVDRSEEILARIVQSVSRKYDCDLKIEFQEGQLVTKFVGDPTYKQWIARETNEIIHCS